MSPLDHLAVLRRRIDETDRAIVGLLAARRAIVAEMRALKVAHDLPRLDGAREDTMRRALREEAARLGVPDALVLGVLEAVLIDSRALVEEPRAVQSATSGDS
jgi:chorismate mutase/prephenate dehydrogenase